MQVDTEPNGNGVGSEDNCDSNIPSRRVARTLPPSNHEDPQEGSSWMFQNRLSYRPAKRSQPESSSDSSDEENLADVTHHRKSSYRPNSTFTVPRKSLFSPLQRKSSGRPEENAYNEAEPDSTNNVEIDISDAQEDPNSSSLSVNSLSRSYPDSNRQTLNISQFNRNIVQTCASTPSHPVDNEAASNTLHSEGSSIPTPHLESSNINTREKRVRKPKNMLYPGESDSEPHKGREPKKRNKQKPRLSGGKPLLNKNRKSNSSLGRKSVSNKNRESNSSSGQKSVTNQDKKETNVSKKR